METYEAADYRNAYARAMELAGFNQIFPSHPAFNLPRVETGPRAAGSGSTQDGYIPPVILKAIAWIESNWAQASNFNPLVQYGEVGPALISHDCGYGIMQVTSGMQNVTGIPNIDQAMIGGHYAFNIARGARILMDKWNMAPEFRPIVGDRNPKIIENWYYALWSYNGFAFKNHPLNPAYDPNRKPFSCGPANDGLGHDRSQYPYQELVFGCIANPPVRGGQRLWDPVPVHLPDLKDARFAEPLSVSNWWPCSQQGICGPMDIPTPNTNNMDVTLPSVTAAELLGLPSLGLSAEIISLQAAPPVSNPIYSVSVGNGGTGLLAWRATASVPWLKLSRHQGVALGADLGARISELTIRAETAGLPSGRLVGHVIVESLHGTGAPRLITVTVNNYPDGTLLQAPGTGVYVLREGIKRGIPNPATFEANGFRWGDVQIVPKSVVDQFLTGNSIFDLLSDGMLVKGDGPTVYVMHGNTKRPIAGPPVIDICRYSWAAVAYVRDGILDGVATGEVLHGAPCPKLAPPNGSLVRGSGAAIYAMFSGLRRHIPDPATFEVLGYRWANVDRLSDAVLAQIMQGWGLPGIISSGNLIKGPGPEIYATDGTQKRHVVSLGVFGACGYGGDAIVTVSSGVLNWAPAGPPVEEPPCPRPLPPDGMLLQGPGPEIYVAHGGTKRHIVDLGVFAGCGYHGGNVNKMAASQLNLIPAGPPLTGAPCP
jgi:hypothetical protein